MKVGNQVRFVTAVRGRRKTNLKRMVGVIKFIIDDRVCILSKGKCYVRDMHQVAETGAIQ
jgi:hypothetical protein